MKKLLVVLFFVAVFAFPVAWYLFLQTFGENQFELPKIEQWQTNCAELNGATLIVQSDAFNNYPNQWKRVQKQVDEQNLIAIQKVDCELNFDLYLVDNEGWVRGQFMVSREEIDRLLAEMDIYVLNENESKIQ